MKFECNDLIKAGTNKYTENCDVVLTLDAHLGGRFGHFVFFSARGGGRGTPRLRDGWGVGFFIEIPGRVGGGALQDGRGRGAGRVSAANWEFWGRGV